MPGDENSDAFGIKPLANAVERVTEGLANFLGAICMPAAEEFGLMLRDRMSAYRLRNLQAIAEKARLRIEKKGVVELGDASPLLLRQIVEDASWVDDESIQDMWAGLLSTAATQAADGDDSLVYTDLLKRVTPFQARFVNYVYGDPRCSSAPQGSLDLQSYFTPPNALIYGAREILELHPGDLARFIPAPGLLHRQILEDQQLNEYAMARFQPQMNALAALELIHEARPRSGYRDGILVFPSAKGLDFYMRCSGQLIYPLSAFLGLQVKLARDRGIDPFTCASPGGYRDN